MPAHSPSHAALHARLHAWYRTHGRHGLPWRRTADPYAILVSEVMLQQTQVKTVLERYYRPFLDRFPTLAALAAADEVAVLKAWEGLGYYQRARNLHRAAKAADGGLPETVGGLMALPGIGRNTAHAVAAFAHRQPVAVLEANVRRVIRRFFALKDPPPALLWEKAEALLDRAEPFDYNQAMMDVGATICTPRAPACGRCPLAPECRGKDAPQAYDPAPAAKSVPTRTPWLVLAVAPGGALAVERKDARLLGGLYGFPQYPADGLPDWLVAAATPIGTVRHVYSHFRLEAALQVVPLHTPPDGVTWEWLLPQAIRALPLSRADQKALTAYEGFIAAGGLAASGSAIPAPRRIRSARRPPAAPR